MLKYLCSLEHFVLIGTNFTKADIKTRSRFAITKTTEADVYQKAIRSGLQDFFLLSTCNRTEFYACTSLDVLKQLVCAHLAVSDTDFNKYFYIHIGSNAVRHFFQVVSGLDSQIIGDYEIVCQVKASIDEARKHNLVGTITDRVTNFAYQTQKKVKAHTNLSSGKYSVSYAAAEMIFHESQSESFRNILIVGAGDFGATVARNLRHYFPSIPMAITNRTYPKAENVAAQVQAEVIAYEDFKNHINRFDIIITTLGLEDYLVQPEDVQGLHEKLFLDLSVPQAVHPDVRNVSGVRLLSVDEVSAFHNELLQQRKLEIPRAEKIIDLYMNQLLVWQQVYHHSHLVLNYKEKIRSLISDQPTPSVGDAHDQNMKLDKIFSSLIQEIREQGYAGCRVIETLNNIVLVEK